MDCLLCCNNQWESTRSDCVLSALEEIRKHYTFFRNTLQERNQEVQRLQERNEKLNKALRLLQREGVQSQSTQKRFRTNEGKAVASAESCGTGGDVVDTCDTSVSLLNKALNSEQLFDTFTQNVAGVGGSTSCSEVIRSPRVRESPKRNKQHEMRKSLKERNDAGRAKSKFAEWRSKGRASPAEQSWTNKFLKPQALNNITSKTCVPADRQERRICLSLKKQSSSKMKQALLPFPAIREKSSVNLDSTVGDDVIDASPNAQSSLKHAKSSRSWLYRSDSKINSTKLGDAETSQNAKVPPFEEIVFDFSPSKRSESLTISSARKLDFAPTDGRSHAVGFVNCDKSSLPLPTDDKSANSSSVVALTPTLPDIIFVDDSCHETTQIGTVDLMEAVVRNDDSLENLRRFESRTIQRCQKEIIKCKTLKDLEKSDGFPRSPLKMKQEKHTENSVANDSTTFFENDDPAIEPKNLISAQENIKFTEGDYDDEDFMPQPIVVKMEPSALETTKKLSIKERFNIDCEDCEKYINFLGHCLTDCEIREHLNKCTRHKREDVLRQNTPDGFWNPFILSFDENDPRNEVLIDTRFVDQKRADK